MSGLPVSNGNPPELLPEKSKEDIKPPKPKPRKPNSNQLHSKPLPLSIHPLPAFHPTNPLSLLRLTYTYILHFLSPPPSHPESLYIGYFSPETRSIHVTDPVAIRALWEMGFFGKGTLSRSEPSWEEREKARLRKERDGVDGGGKAEDATRRRREERRAFKLERARVEREKVERQRAVEGGRVEEGMVSEDVRAATETDPLLYAKVQGEGRVPDAELVQTMDPTTPLLETQAATDPTETATPTKATNHEEPLPDPEVTNQEHLQLTLEEAFFLTYTLGVLSVLPPPSTQPSPSPFRSRPYPTTDLLYLSSHYSSFPPIDAGSGIAPDDAFLLNYVTYHHFRSLGWVVRPGTKFGVDYLLYNRGPVFSHAEFGVLILPSYTHRYWNTPGGRSRRRVRYPSEAEGYSSAVDDDGEGEGMVGGGGGKDWWWLHCVNRVQSQVRKTLVLCYVDVPAPWEVGLDDEWDAEMDIGLLLRGYRVREFVVKRWVPNRTRD